MMRWQCRISSWFSLYLLGLEILVSLGIDTLVVCVDLEDLHVGDGFYDAMGDLVPQLSGSCWHWYIY